ncbi:hypothetical protein [Clostridium paridis]|uniref:Transmembrane protein n=1 Tax=Clostridium paridis TaxID=2803863 RepID=A0A937FET6_9CLOT|nr:hypothetical protein [Clostridium paridis]MBL4932690.1 hypothetical protein [Clostridium paridis]
MHISKAIKKQKSAYRNFKAMMIIIAALLPIVTLLFGMTEIFYIAYLVIIEMMIFFSLVYRISWERLEFSCYNNRLKYKAGLFSKEGLIFCDKVALVHTEKLGEEMDIIVISSVNFKNRSFKLVTKTFLKKYPVIAQEYIKIKEFDPENTYYFLVLKKGALKKYLLLDIIFKNCVKAIYTSNAIENIKISRGQKELVKL